MTTEVLVTCNRVCPQGPATDCRTCPKSPMNETPTPTTKSKKRPGDCACWPDKLCAVCASAGFLKPAPAWKNNKVTLNVIETRMALTALANFNPSDRIYDTFRNTIEKLRAFAVAPFCHYCTEPQTTKSRRGYPCCEAHKDDYVRE